MEKENPKRAGSVSPIAAEHFGWTPMESLWAMTPIREIRLAVGKKLYIPEGVKVIPSATFADYTVLWEISFPKSLKYIGCANSSEQYQGNTFAHCRLPDVVLPENLELLGKYAFVACWIRSLTIPYSIRKNYSPVVVRHFKGCRMGEICVPAEFRDALEDHRNGRSFGEMVDPELGQLCYVKLTHNELQDVEVYHVLSRFMER